MQVKGEQEVFVKHMTPECNFVRNT